MAGERLPARFSLRSQLWFRWTGKCFETATSHMQTVDLDEKIISHEEAVERKFSSLPENLKEKLDKKKLSAIIGLIEKLTFPDHELTEQNLELVYNTIKRYNLDLNKQEIKLIWE
jgi:hypothetical protein